MNDSIINISQKNNIDNFIITTDQNCKKTKIYSEVSDIIYKLIENGLVHLGKGYCISMSDIIYTLLLQNGIHSKIIECQLTVTNKETNTTSLIGFDNLRGSEGQVDTHVVIVTSTEPAILIDMSILHMLPNNLYGVIDSVKRLDNNIILNINTPQVDLTYQEKKKDTIPLLHQKSIIDRINTDITIFKNLRILKIAIFVALIISSLNACRGLYDYYLVYVDRTNYWGPKTTKEMYDKINSIEEKLNKENR